MSSLINKVKEAIHSDKSTEQPEGTHGPHSSRAANTADPRVDSDRDHRAGHSSNLTGTGTGDYSTGTNYTTDTRNTRGTDGPATSTDGPHKSNVMNKMDPRVDSDRDHSRNMGANPHGTSGTGAYNASDSTRTGGIGGTTGTAGYSSRDTSLPEGTTGPHSSRMANAADPRVDSDRDGSRTAGTGTGTYGTSTTGPTGTHGTHGTTGFGSRDTSLPEGTTGPHSSRMANAADPRVDSDRDGSRTAGTGTYGQTTVGGGIGGTTGTSGFSSAGTGAHGPSGHSSGLPEGSTGPHNSRVANAADPRVDSDLDGSRKLGNRGAGAGAGAGTTNYGSSTGTHGTQGTSLGGAGGSYGTGPAPNTAGPHKSDMMNKADPRVDSDLDGSKTVGRDKTFERSNDYAGKDPTDAAQVPPSVLQKHVPSEIHHEHDEHDHTRRHSVSHQEKHRGL
ncbi:hypothetical protein LCI18_011465 [Fusarium solani-melongenae]|uniref:Uncharacterized protein n=1 Tax=Fusarium solani subsp. cucurbitae TaxID=2747967 RepID=A0ACD3ZH26_FUSSC|nr:hypothetical protein LCI18_011465 [Fusarium solani-melongenae]